MTADLAPLPDDMRAGVFSFPLQTLTKRADFLAASRALRAPCPAFLLQARDRRDGTSVTRIGYTCSKKVGNAVTRNRAKRRLRALAQAVLPSAARPGWDYVLVGRAAETVTRPMDQMHRDLQRALEKLHR
ncbi:MAG: ribonuclease P protein component [Pseudomonadota bacterium]